MNIVEIWKGASDEQLDILFTRQAKTIELIKKHNLRINKERTNWIEISTSKDAIHNLIALLKEILKNAKTYSK